MSSMGLVVVGAAGRMGLALIRTIHEIDGVHLEGPWLSPARCGAHDPAVLSDPRPGSIAGLPISADLSQAFAFRTTRCA